MDGEGTPRLGDLFRNRRERGRPQLPVMSVTMNNGLVERSTLERKTDSALAPDEHLLIKKGDIAYNMMRMWQGASGLAQRDGIISPAYVVLAPSDGIDPLFASYWFKTARMIYLFWAYSYGLTGDRLRLYYKDFAHIPVSPLPLDDQRAIGQCLATWDSAINGLARMLAAKRAKLRWLRESVFRGRVRLSRYRARGDVIETRWGQHHAEWTVARINDVAEINRRTLGEDTDPEHRFRYIDLAAVDRGHIKRRLPQLTFRVAPSRARRVVRLRDVLLSTVRPNLQGFGVVEDDRPDMVCSTGFAVLTPRVDTDAYFVHEVLYTDFVMRQLHGLVAGSNYPAITSREAGKLRIPLPPSSEERAWIGNTVQTLRREISLMERQLRMLKLQKRGLMQRLLTGWIRVPNRKGVRS